MSGIINPCFTEIKRYLICKRLAIHDHLAMLSDDELARRNGSIDYRKLPQLAWECGCALARFIPEAGPGAAHDADVAAIKDMAANATLAQRKLIRRTTLAIVQPEPNAKRGRR